MNSHLKKARCIYKTTDESTRVTLENIFGKDALTASIVDLMDSIRDVCEAIGKNYDERYSEERMKYVAPHLRVQMEWEDIAEAYNEGWEPDYSNSSQQKWYPYYRYSSGASGRGLRFRAVRYVCDYAHVGPRQTFKNEALCRKAIEKFPNTFDTFYNS